MSENSPDPGDESYDHMMRIQRRLKIVLGVVVRVIVVLVAVKVVVVVVLVEPILGSPGTKGSL